MKKSILLFMALGASLTLCAQKLGKIDSTFGTNGRTIKDVKGSAYNETITGSAVGPNGDIYVYGYSTTNVGADLFVAHYLANGQLDAAFANQGIFISDLSLGGDDYSGQIIRKSDGKLVLVGSTPGNAYRGPFLMQLNSDGSLDANFGSGGIERYDLGKSSFAKNLVERADGKLVLGGSYQNGNDYDYYALVVHPDGTRASGFGTNGFMSYGFANKQETLEVLETDGNSNILLGGNYSDLSTDRISLIMLDTAGKSVSGFGLNGWVFVQEGSNPTYLSELKFDAAGNMIAVGWVTGGINNDLYIFKLLPNGQFDKNFDTDGKRQFGLKVGNPGNEQLYSLDIQNDGKIVCYGYYLENGVKYGLLIRFKADGSSDSGFGGPYGYTLIPHSDFNNSLSINQIVRPSNERIILVGRTKENSDYDMMLVAFHGTEPFPASIAMTSKRSLKIFPNPAHSSFSVDADWSGGTLALIDLKGRIVAEWNSAAPGYALPEELSKGIYLLKLTTSTGVYSSKIMVN